MQVAVWRLFADGKALDRQRVRGSRPREGTLVFRLRITGRESRWDIFMASLEDSQGNYCIPCLDGARIEEVEGRWLRIAGREVIPRGRSVKSKADTYPQVWWCRVAGQRPRPAPGARS